VTPIGGRQPAAVGGAASDGGQMEGYLIRLNPSSASGTFGVGGTSSISSGATYHNSMCTIS